MSEGVSDPAPDQSIDQRVGALETGQERMSDKLDKILGLVGAGGTDDGGPGHDGEPSGPGNVADEIRQQLDERDAKAKADAEKQAGADRLGAIETKLSELAEKPPAPLPRRVEKIMGWT